MLISKEDLESRLNNLQSMGKIAEELSVSYDTVYRRAVELNLIQGWHDRNTTRIWTPRDKSNFVISVDPERTEEIKEFLRNIPCGIVRFFGVGETWRDIRSKLSGNPDYKIQKERFDSLQRIAIAESEAAF